MDLFNINELSISWERSFYYGDWRPDTLKLTSFEKNLIEDITELLPRHMPVYDWNLPYAECIILILRKEFKEVNETYQKIDNKMNKTKWTKERKELCEKYWDHCAQEELYCKKGFDIPCDIVLEAEKRDLTK